MGHDDDLDALDATGLAAAIGNGDVSAREVLERALRRIDERNPAVNAVTAVAGADVLEKGAAAAGPLAGVPFVVKDLKTAVAGMPSTSGSRLFADVVATEDAEIVTRYRRAGLVVIGMTNSPEFGLSPSTEPLLKGPTRNPYRGTHSSGGSSGGTAAAIAVGIVPAGHATDGGGSIRIPASACGLVGLKPTRSRTPTRPRRNAFSYPIGVHHALTRSVRDSALLLDVVAGATPGDPIVLAPPARPYVEEVGTPPGSLRIALSTTTPSGEPVHDECAAAARATATLLEELGHQVVEATPSYPLEALQAVMSACMLGPLVVDVDARLAALGRDLADDDLEPFSRVLYDVGRGLSGADVIRALQELERAAHDIGELFVEHDLLLTPTMARPTPELGVLDTADVQSMYHLAGVYSTMTSPFNVTGQPAISLPLGRDGVGLPVGVQLVARFGREDLLLRVASQLEAASPWDVSPVWPTR